MARRLRLAAATQGRAGWDGSGVVFVVGHPRSGTTFLGRFLGSHPEVSYLEEAALLPLAGQLLREVHARQERLRLNARVEPLHAQHGGPLATQADSLGLVEARRGRRRSEELVRDMIGGIVADFLELRPAPVLVEKTPQGAKHLEVLCQIAPRARAIHIVRDPRAVVASALRRTARRGRPTWLRETDGDDELHAAIASWNRIVGHALEQGGQLGKRVHLVRHEDVLADPRTRLDEVVRFCSLEWAGSLDEFLRTGRASGHGGGIRSLERDERWRRELTDEQVAAVEAGCHDLMAGLGYL